MTRPDRRPGVTRRQLLALSGAGTLAGVAGCSGIFPGQSEPTVDADALSQIVAGEAPRVSETLPVDIEASFVAEQRSIAKSDLDRVPAPFDREAIPNGVIRGRLNDMHESATESLARIDEAEVPYERLERANRAQVSAHEVRSAWRAIDDDLTLAALRESVPSIEGRIDSTVQRWSHVGDDPVRAVVVHEEFESKIRAARNWVSSRNSPERSGGTALDVADLAEDLERARTSATVAAYVFDRFRGRLDATTDQRPRFEAAREELRSRIRDRQDALPSQDIDDPTSLVDRDVGETAGVRALVRLGSEATYRAEEAIAAADGPYLANEVVEAADALVHVRAFEALRERIASGDDLAVESVDDISAFRSDAISAVESAQNADPGRLLVRELLPRFANRIRQTDERFARESGTTTLSSVAYDAQEYVIGAVTCRVVPRVSADAAGALRKS
ncbi:MAG: hypothetical protein ABEI27_02650 [Halobellus sp.]|uniref:hypothetical protein n=1 Tax=Halobellus sp. TaxID=1979212 RepID=UPI0035D4B187